MNDDILEVYFSTEKLEGICERIGREISEEFKGENLLLISVLKGSIMFMADLMRHISIPCKIDFITAASYGAGTESSGTVQITDLLSVKDIENYHVIVVEDILDSGRTLQKLTEHLSAYNPKSISICTLLDKPERRDKSVTIKAKYVGSEVQNQFVVGYGLDYNQNYRNLPYIGILKPEIYS